MGKLKAMVIKCARNRYHMKRLIVPGPNCMILLVEKTCKYLLLAILVQYAILP